MEKNRGKNTRGEIGRRKENRNVEKRAERKRNEERIEEIRRKLQQRGKSENKCEIRENEKGNRRAMRIKQQRMRTE